MVSFITIRFKRKITKRFEEFSKTQFKTHTETMDAILGFFLLQREITRKIGSDWKNTREFYKAAHKYRNGNNAR